MSSSSSSCSSSSAAADYCYQIFDDDDNLLAEVEDDETTIDINLPADGTHTYYLRAIHCPYYYTDSDEYKVTIENEEVVTIPQRDCTNLSYIINSDNTLQIRWSYPVSYYLTNPDGFNIYYSTDDNPSAWTIEKEVEWYNPHGLYFVINTTTVFETAGTYYFKVLPYNLAGSILYERDTDTTLTVTIY